MSRNGQMGRAPSKHRTAPKHTENTKDGIGRRASRQEAAAGGREGRSFPHIVSPITDTIAAMGGAASLFLHFIFHTLREAARNGRPAGTAKSAKDAEEGQAWRKVTNHFRGGENRQFTNDD